MIIVLSTYPDRKRAEEAASEIVRKELAACVNVIKVGKSFYRWKGKLESEEEHLLLIKTKMKAYKQLEMFIKEGHPYEVPEIIYFRVEGGHRPYLSWLDKNVLSRLLTVPLDLRVTKRAGVPLKEPIKARKPRTMS
uniref:Divalent-cation tolerance protein CutA n=1 Tax=Candidatus Methanophaga sp. ANME-1 ERB7 TaxID=2759913 RepID=A0A7G9Z2G7_9EURY|nr:divalent-cation tolerance protein CutA [Methanosarcinales archaeon ANME-1 ERB7]